jgi:hypothetical protein
LIKWSDFGLVLESSFGQDPLNRHHIKLEINDIFFIEQNIIITEVKTMKKRLVMVLFGSTLLIAMGFVGGQGDVQLAMNKAEFVSADESP